MSKADDFMESQRKVAEAMFGGQKIESSNIADEDMDVFMRYLALPMATIILSAMGPEGAALWGFNLGIMWNSFKVQYDDPMNDLLKDVDI